MWGMGSVIRSHIGCGGEWNTFISVWKPLSSKHVLETLRKSPKRKAQRGQYMLTVDLGRYKVSTLETM